MPKGINWISPDVKALLVKAYQEKAEGGKLLARQYGVSATTLYRVLKRYGIPIDPAKQRGAPGVHRYKFKPAVYRQIVARYLRGDSVQKIERTMQCSRWMILTAVKRAGHVVKRRGRQIRPWTDEDKATILQLHAAGWSQGAVAHRFKTDQTTISRILIAQGVRSNRLKRERHGSWKGGRVQTGSGYIAIFPESDDALSRGMRMSNGYVAEHRLVMAQHLGRPLRPDESVHHINGDKTDNRLENLQIRQGKHGKGTVLVCGDCGSRNLVTRPLMDATPA